MVSKREKAFRGDIVPSGYSEGRIKQFTPQQKRLHESLFEHVGPESYLSRLAAGDEELFNEIEEPALRQFGDFQASTGSRFAGLGSGSQRGSGLKNQLTQGAVDLSSQLASQRQNLQRQAFSDLMGLSNTLLSQHPYEKFLVQKDQQQKEKEPSFGQKFFSATLPVAGAALGGFFGGPTGAAVGYGAGSGISKSFMS